MRLERTHSYDDNFSGADPEFGEKAQTLWATASIFGRAAEKGAAFMGHPAVVITAVVAVADRPSLRYSSKKRSALTLESGLVTPIHLAAFHSKKFSLSS